MPKFLNPNIPELLGVTPVSKVTDKQIWDQLVSPMAKALLGKIVSSKLEVRETEAGAFPGDEVTNLNDHKLYGGKSGFVRNRYIVTTYRTEYGAFLIKRDGVKFKALGWFGDVDRGQLELIYKVALRDRRYDGTKQANDCSLIEFEGFDDPNYNLPLTYNGEPVKAVEISTYCFMPGSRTSDADGDAEYERFIANPYRFANDPKKFRELFDRAWQSKRSPGQVSNAIPDVSKFVPAAFEKMARDLGYDFIENAPSHYHVAMWSRAIGYRFTDPEMGKILLDLQAGIKRLKDKGIKLTRPQESWVTVIQCLPDQYIPEGMNLGGPKWPQDNIGPENLWMHKPLNEKAELILADILKQRQENEKK